MGQVSAPAEFTRHVDDLWGSREQLPELIENAEVVKRMLGSPGFKVVMAVVEAEIATITRKLQSDRVFEQAEYAKSHGKLAALSAFSDAADAVVSRAEEYTAKANAEAGGESSAGR